MKTYTLDEIIENYRADIDEFVCGEYVPADVARQLYDALAYVEGKAKEVEEDSVGEEDKDFHPWLAQARAALAAAVGE